MNLRTYLAASRGLCRHHGERIVNRFGAGACSRAAGMVVAEEEHPGAALPAGGEGVEGDGESTRMREIECGRLVPLPPSPARHRRGLLRSKKDTPSKRLAATIATGGRRRR